MKRMLYHIVTLAVEIVCVIVFRARLNITAMSVLPLFLIALSSFQAAYFNNHRHREDFNTNNYADLTDTEWEKMSVCVRDAYIFSVPLYVPFIFFFSSWVKPLSVILFMASVTGGSIYFRLRYGRELRERYDNEKKELDEQRSKESLGRWK